MNQPSTSLASGTSAAIASSKPLAVEHSVEQLDVLLFGIEEMIDFEPTEMLVLQSLQARRGRSPMLLSRLP